MSKKLESVQKQAAKIIFGHSIDYQELLGAGKMESLKGRREKEIQKFANKAINDDRFVKKWFPENTCLRDARFSTRRNYFEEQTHTARMKNNPIQAMIRILNKQSSATHYY